MFKNSNLCFWLSLPVYTLKERCLQVLRGLVPSQQVADLEIPETLKSELLQVPVTSNSVPSQNLAANNGISENHDHVNMAASNNLPMASSSASSSNDSSARTSEHGSQPNTAVNSVSNSGASTSVTSNSSSHNSSQKSMSCDPSEWSTSATDTADRSGSALNSHKSMVSESSNTYQGVPEQSRTLTQVCKRKEHSSRCGSEGDGHSSKKLRAMLLSRDTNESQPEQEMAGASQDSKWELASKQSSSSSSSEEDGANDSRDDKPLELRCMKSGGSVNPINTNGCSETDKDSSMSRVDTVNSGCGHSDNSCSSNVCNSDTQTVEIPTVPSSERINGDTRASSHDIT